MIESSPHARGWSPCCRTTFAHYLVFPACAGVVRRSRRALTISRRLPRMRGGGPVRESTYEGAGVSSPHARGWSPIAIDFQSFDKVFPACAGVVPTHLQCAGL